MTRFGQTSAPPEFFIFFVELFITSERVGEFHKVFQLALFLFISRRRKEL